MMRGQLKRRLKAIASGMMALAMVFGLMTPLTAKAAEETTGYLKDIKLCGTDIWNGEDVNYASIPNFDSNTHYYTAYIPDTYTDIRFGAELSDKAPEGSKITYSYVFNFTATSKWDQTGKIKSGSTQDTSIYGERAFWGTVKQNVLAIEVGTGNDVQKYIIELRQGEPRTSTLTNVKLVSEPKKTKYVVGQKFEINGLELEAEYSDNTTEIVNNNAVLFAPNGELTLEDKSVTFCYMGKTVTVAIKVSEPYTFKGTGTKDDPFILDSEDAFDALADEVKGGNFHTGDYFTVTNDVTLSAGWEGIGSLQAGYGSAFSGKKMNPFSGIILGNNHTITFAKGSKALLSYARDAEINDLNIYGEFIDGNGLLENYVVDYGVDGSSYSDDDPKATLTCNNVTIKEGTTILKSGITGGFASGIDHIDLNNCTVEKGVKIGCNADGTSAELSDIGSFGGAVAGTFKNCVSYADVYGVNNIGGIAGIRGQSTDIFDIIDCEFHGTVNATGNNAGGILGSGYVSYSAPNGFGAVVIGCKVDGTVTGVENVGGILGGESGVDQPWDNGIGRIVDNTFTGKVSGEKRVGAIIGFIRGLNSNTVIENNLYAADCGADAGIGQIIHVDTDAVAFGMKDGVFHFNTANFDTYTDEDWAAIYAVVDSEWEDTNRNKGRSIAKPNYNRHDDPTGVDAEKLTRVIVETPADDNGEVLGETLTNEEGEVLGAEYAKTGDTFNYVWVMLLAVSGISAGLVAVYRRKKEM